MPNTYACKGVSNPNIPIFPPRVCTSVVFVSTAVVFASMLKMKDYLSLNLLNLDFNSINNYQQ